VYFCHDNDAVQVLKTTKVIVVMLAGIFIFQKRYRSLDFISAAIIICMSFVLNQGMFLLI